MTTVAGSTPRHCADLTDLASHVRDGDQLCIGGTLFSRVPWALLQAVASSRPRDLHVLSWGGGFPLELLLEVDAVSRLTFCFAGLDVLGSSPRFRSAVEQEDIETVELTAMALHQGLSAGKRRLDSELLPRPTGSDLVDGPGFPRSTPDPVSGRPMLASGALRPDVLLLHATAADEHGNMEIAGARGLDLVAIPASTTVLATVDEVVPTDRLGRRRHAHVIPREFVTAFLHAPGAAAPFSSLPHHPADFTGILALADRPTLVDAPEIPAVRLTRPEDLTTPQVLATVRDDDQQPDTSPSATIDERMVVRLARLYTDGEVCSVGAVSPLATASYLLAKSLHAPHLTLITNGGGYVDVAPRPLLFGLGEVLDHNSAVTHMGGEECYEWYYQSGRVDWEVVSVAQIDGRGDTNNSWVTSPSGRRIRLPGQGGMADVMEMHRNVAIYLPRQSPLNTPERVSMVSSGRRLYDDADRRAAGYRPGDVVLVTDLAVFRRDDETGRLRITERFPHATDDAILAATGFEIDHDDLAGSVVVDDPTTEELVALRDVVDPLGLRRLEFVASRNRGDLLAELVASEHQLMLRLDATTGSA